MCETFGLPLVAGGAVDQPVGLALDIMTLRTYARAKALVDRAEAEDGYEAPGWAWQLVSEIRIWMMLQDRERGDE